MIYKLKFSEENSDLHSIYKDWLDANGWGYEDLFVLCRDVNKTCFILRHIGGHKEMFLAKTMFEPAPPPTKEIEDYL